MGRLLRQMTLRNHDWIVVHTMVLYFGVAQKTRSIFCRKSACDKNLKAVQFTVFCITVKLRPPFT